RRRAIAARLRFLATCRSGRHGDAGTHGANRAQHGVMMYTATGTLDVEQRVTEFAPLVWRMAHYLASKLPASVEIDDIIQAGLIGLMDAAQRFEESQGFKFETFASQRIKGAMLDELRQSDWLPRSARKSMRQIETAITKLEQRLGRPPTERELAAELGVSLEA